MNTGGVILLLLVGLVVTCPLWYRPLLRAVCRHQSQTSIDGAPYICDDCGASLTDSPEAW